MDLNPFPIGKTCGPPSPHFAYFDIFVQKMIVNTSYFQKHKKNVELSFLNIDLTKI